MPFDQLKGPACAGLAALAISFSVVQKIEAAAFFTTGPMGSAHVSHTATLLSNGKVLVAGGNGGGGNVAELYDPATGLWTLTGALSISHLDHTATLLPNGKVLVAGGYGGSVITNRAEL